MPDRILPAVGIHSSPDLVTRCGFSRGILSWRFLGGCGVVFVVVLDEELLGLLHEFPIANNRLRLRFHSFLRGVPVVTQALAMAILALCDVILY